MDKTRKPLERFVALIEKNLLPRGFNVVVRDKRYDDSGVQIAELDVLVSGVLGSTQIECLIECRDHPSEGASPIGWIQQPIGKRQQFNFNKVIAVSTTGFTPGAVDLARKSGIELRTLSQITNKEIQSWFNLSALSYGNIRGHLIGWHPILKDKKPSEKNNIRIQRLYKEYYPPISNTYPYKFRQYYKYSQSLEEYISDIIKRVPKK